MSTNEGYKDLTSLTAWVRYTLYAQILIAVISIVSGNLEYQLLSDYQNEIYTSQEQAIADWVANNQRQELIETLYVIAFVVSGFLILRWIHRANYNARQLGAENMKFSPGWSIGYYFIPILTLWKPYQAMKEIWKASKRPSDWGAQDTCGILPLWWFLWLVSIFLGQAIFRLSMQAEEIHELIKLNIVTQITDALYIPLALVFLAIVNRIQSMQVRRLASANNQMQPTADSVG
ncbi:MULTISPECIES: DUF4328 domain-containing protein [unclassified Halomonas]|uniref:DUF4328 domain-containing protein n=1 Tax=unclassified Halomonas TaxID=2609666 RepID=UPI0007D8FF74|nr:MULTISPECIES: DUF4328 domain-containing protein [unclassified Halomonas]MBT2788628.1 DUF4328 domain-containing protein [Halomonas sp. ISL-106]MBT2798219.1 DUF4328 domain-containing protein [Halomonas sp. ISL-104]OAL60769.1 hypothetical protein A6R74_18830 [Halomonas sp. ALS9]